MDQKRLDRLAAGLIVKGVRYGPIQARLEPRGDRSAAANVWIEVSLAEGKNREIRRVLEAVGLRVNRLIRISYGPFTLGDLPTGAVVEIPPRRFRPALANLIAAVPQVAEAAPKPASKPLPRPRRSPRAARRPSAAGAAGGPRPR